MDAISDVSRGSQIFSAVPIFPPLPDPLDIDELLGFNAATRKKYIVEEPVDTKYFVRNKIFINHVDSFIGKHIVSVLSEKSTDTTMQQNLREENVANEDEKKVIKEVEKSKDETNGNRNTEKSEKSNKKNKGGKSPSKSTEGKGTAKSSHNKSLDTRKLLHSPLLENIECAEDNGQEENYLYDTSKLTVSEYYELVEMESRADREEFLKEKLGKYISELKEDSISKLELSERMNYKRCVFENELEIIGTLISSETEENNIEGVNVILRINYDDPEFFDHVIQCGVIIYIVNESSDQVVEATWVLNSIINFMDEMKIANEHVSDCPPIFIIVSTFMTWSLTKPLSLNNPELPFIEKDYRKRKPHPNYELLYALEEQVAKVQMNHQIRSLIIVSGIPYGHEEDEFSIFFKMALHYQHLPLYFPSNNFIPTIHVENLGHVIKESLKRIDEAKTPFIFAKDPAQNTMGEITKAISKSLGSGYCELLTKPFAFIKKDISQDVYDKITTNINLESCYPLFKEEDILWKYESGFVENIKNIVKEYVIAKNINPLRVIVYGTAINGTLENIAVRLCEYLHIHCIDRDALIIEYISEMLRKQQYFDSIELQRKTDDPDLDDLKNVRPIQELIMCEDYDDLYHELEMFRKLNIQTVDDVNNLSDFEKDNIIITKLKMKPYCYYGYLLEEYPQTVEQATALFTDHDKEVRKDEVSNEISSLPEFVIHLKRRQESSDQIIIDPSSQISEDHIFDSSKISVILEEEFEKGNTNSSDDIVGSETVSIVVGEDVNSTENLNITYSQLKTYFLEINEKCKVINLDFKESDSEDYIIKELLSILEGGDSNTRLVDPSLKCGESLSENLNNQNPPQDEVENIEHDMSKEIKDYRNKKESKETEEIVLAVKSYPLLSYLINFVFPTLTTGILEVTAQRPQDPVEFLAEYLFKNNPDGHMMPQNELKFEDALTNKQKPVAHIDSKACLA